MWQSMIERQFWFFHRVAKYCPCHQSNSCLFPPVRSMKRAEPQPFLSRYLPTKISYTSTEMRSRWDGYKHLLPLEVNRGKRMKEVWIPGRLATDCNFVPFPSLAVPCEQAGIANKTKIKCFSPCLCCRCLKKEANVTMIHLVYSVLMT